MIRVPRSLQELTLNIAAAADELTHEASRTVTTQELAQRLGVSCSDLTAARLAACAYRPDSYDQPVRGSKDQRIIDTLGDVDRDIETAGWRQALRRGLQALPDRERNIVAMRYFADMSQAQIAAAVGISQMHVSRLISKALNQLRSAITGTASQ